MHCLFFFNGLRNSCIRLSQRLLKLLLVTQERKTAREHITAVRGALLFYRAHFLPSLPCNKTSKIVDPSIYQTKWNASVVKANSICVWKIGNNDSSGSPSNGTKLIPPGTVCFSLFSKHFPWLWVELQTDKLAQIKATRCLGLTIPQTVVTVQLSGYD